MNYRRQRNRLEHKLRDARQAAARRRAHFDRRDKESRMAPRKPKFVGEVPVRDFLNGGQGEIIGTAKMEKLPGGAYIAHIDASGMTADNLRRGFSLGSFSVKEEDDAMDA